MTEFPTEYLGDAVYAAVENGMLKLMTGSHDDPSNTIKLEPEIMGRLISYFERAEAYYAAEREKILAPPALLNQQIETTAGGRLF